VGKEKHFIELNRKKTLYSVDVRAVFAGRLGVREKKMKYEIRTGKKRGERTSLDEEIHPRCIRL